MTARALFWCLLRTGWQALRLEGFRAVVRCLHRQWVERCKLAVPVLFLMSFHSSYFKGIIQMHFTKFPMLFYGLGSTSSREATEISSLFPLFLLPQFILPVDNEFFWLLCVGNASHKIWNNFSLVLQDICKLYHWKRILIPPPLLSVSEVC